MCTADHLNDIYIAKKSRGQPEHQKQVKEMTE